MAEKHTLTLDGNEATASVAHRTNEVIAIYPITPSSDMGEHSDRWSAMGQKNIWGAVPTVVEMQSEAGAAGAVHGALQAGSLSTSFTASQGLLLFIPTMYLVAGELTPFVLHVSARTVASHALSIFGDHGDVMACRQTGFAMLSSDGVQGAHDFALIAQSSTLRSRVPFMHFFDGFRTSHEVKKIEMLSDDDLRHMVPDDLVAAHRGRALTPDKPLLRGTAQNPDTFFQAREASSPFYNACPGIVQEEMDKFAKRTGRQYKLFDYFGAPDADRVIISMGSSADTIHEYIEWAVGQGHKVGVLKVRLYRPFSIKHFVQALPASVKTISVLDRVKEAGAPGDPLYLDVITALREGKEDGLTTLEPKVLAGRYGLSSKEFNPGCIHAVFENMAASKPINHFVVGIVDDVNKNSLKVDPEFDIEHDDVKRAMFYGLGSDGTVGANKNSIKIISEEAGLHGQGYFVYDSKKAGAVTVSHLRFGPNHIRSAYLIKQANFIACHQTEFINKYDMLSHASEGAIFLLNTPAPADKAWNTLPREMQEALIQKKMEFWVIDGYEVGRQTGMGVHINTIMQTCFFKLSKVLPPDEAIKHIKKYIEKTYSKKGEAVVKKNHNAVDHAIEHLHQVQVPSAVSADHSRPKFVSDKAPEFVKKVLAVMMAGDGDTLPVSAFPVDGTYPTATTQWEKRCIALDIPTWNPEVCIQCNKCALICPHACLRPKVYDPAKLSGAPATFKSTDFKGKEYAGQKYTIQVAPEDCTGCAICVNACPSKDKANPERKAINMAPLTPLRDAEAKNFEFFLTLPEVDRTTAKQDVKGSQFLLPLFEFSSCCAGCGETPYIKLATQLFGDRMLIGNATGCASIYGGNLPTTPYCQDANGRGPTWCNSLFEDNAEFAFGLRLAVDKHQDQAVGLLKKLSGQIGDELVGALIGADQTTEAGILAQRERVTALKQKLQAMGTAEAKWLELLADYLVKKSVWAFGGDGWAYDIGYGGLDHVIAAGRNVNLLVMDTEVYSNTGGQASKSTPIGAVAKFAMAGKALPKKDLGLIAMAYGNVYVAKVAIGAKDSQTVKAFLEAESYDGPSLIIAYSHCIAHGIELVNGLEQQKLAVDSAHWPLFRFDPRRVEQGLPPLQLDSGEAKIDLAKYVLNEQRYRVIEKQNPEHFKELMAMAQREVTNRFALYKGMSELALPVKTVGDAKK
jgi:pyruvate-ferredoxin/flavodoxin oxidoreductase